jgi:uncharacterized linocin/CFP29 family protein
MSTTIIDSWPASVWSQINGTPASGSTPAQPGLLLTNMGAIRIALKVFPSTVQGNDAPVSADTVDLKTGIPSVGVTRPVVSITKQFQLADLHVNPGASPGLPMVANQVSLAAQALALIEDALFFQGKNAEIPPSIAVANAADLQDGLLGVAEKHHKIQVHPHSRGGYGTATYDAVLKGISQFSTASQAVPFALILDPTTYADANKPLGDTMVAPATAIQALIQGGFYMSPGLPPRTGLLVALGGANITPTSTASPTASAMGVAGAALTSGATTSLIVGTAPVVEYTNTDGKYYYFTARESIQYYNMDPRALIALEFLTKTNNP